MSYVGRDEDAVREFVERMSIALADWGFPRMSGRVLFALMVADEPGLTAAGLAERLEISPSAVSVAVRHLIQLGLLTRQRSPGERQDIFRMPSGAWYEGALAKRAAYAKVIELADDGVRALGGTESGDGGPGARRVAEMRDFYVFVRSEIGAMMARWQDIKAARAAAEEGISSR